MKQANVINNRDSQSRDSERYKRSLLAASMVLLFAAQCQGGPTTTPIVPGITSSTSFPGGFIFDGTNSWVADAKLGLCQVNPGNPGTLSNCVPLPPTKNAGVPAIIGQPAYDPATGFVYLPDQSTASMGIWRYHFNPITSLFDTPVNIATALGGQRPGAIAFGVPTAGVTDGSLYVTMTANSNIVRVTTPEAAAQTVATMSTTISGLPAHGLAKVGTQLWVADRDGIIDIVDPVGCANKCRGAILTQIFGLASPLSVTWDATNSYVYIGTPAGVIRHARITGVTDTYSSSYGAPCVPGIPGVLVPPIICPGLFSNVTAVGLDGGGNLLLVDDPSAGQPSEASVYMVPAGSPPDGQGATPQPPITQLPTIFPNPIANPGVLYSNGLTTPKGAVFMGTHLWVVDTAHGFCKVDPALPSPSLIACAGLPGGFVPGAPAFQPSLQPPAAATQAYAYLPDTTPGGAGILRFPFGPPATATETLGAGVTVLTAAKLAAAAPGATAPTSLAFGPDHQLYAAMAGVPNILRITAPEAVAPAVSSVRSIGSMFEAGSVNIAFHNADLFNVETIDSTTMFNATLCKGTCPFLFLAVVLDAPTAVGTDANYVYIGDTGGIVWRYDPVADTITRLADTGVLADGTLTQFSAISGIAVDNSPANLGQVTVVDQTTVWKLISSAVPTITKIVPTQAVEGAVASVVITGTNFLPSLVVDTCSLIVPSNVTFVSSTQITATFTIGVLGAGPCAVTVTTVNGTSAVYNFTVLPPPPVLTTILPSAGFRDSPVNGSVNVNINGTNLTGGTLSAIPGVTINAFSVVSDILITATFAIDPAAALGPRSIVVTTPSGASNALPFTVNAPPPVLTGINPTQGGANTTVPVTLTGTDLLGATLNPPAGFTLSGAPVVTLTSVTASLVIGSAVAAGPQSITVTTAGGTSNAVTFTVVPTLTGIAPPTGVAGQSPSVTLTGTNLTGATSINTGTAGITVSNLTVVSSTQVTATFTIDVAAVTGNHSISVVTPNGTTVGAVTFNVLPPFPPTLTNISPASSPAFQIVPVTLTGANMIGVTGINTDTAGITVTGLTVVSSTQVNATFTIAANAVQGVHNISVVNPVGPSGTVPFTVQAPLSPTLTSIAPASGTAGSSVPVTLTGSNLNGATAITTGAAGIGVSNFVAVSSTQVTATFTIAAGAGALGVHNISVVNPVGTTAQPITFNVLPPLPAITSLNNTSIKKGSNIGMVVNGTNLGNLPVTLQVLLNGAPVNPTFVTITNFQPISQTQVKFNWTFVVATAPISDGTHAYTVTLTTAGGTSNAFPFTVTN